MVVCSLVPQPFTMCQENIDIALPHVPRFFLSFQCLSSSSFAQLNTATNTPSSSPTSAEAVLETKTKPESEAEYMSPLLGLAPPRSQHNTIAPLG